MSSGWLIEKFANNIESLFWLIQWPLCCLKLIEKKQPQQLLKFVAKTDNKGVAAAKQCQYYPDIIIMPASEKLPHW